MKCYKIIWREPSFIAFIVLCRGQKTFLYKLTKHVIYTFAKVYWERTFSSRPEKDITRSCMSLSSSSLSLKIEGTPDVIVKTTTQNKSYSTRQPMQPINWFGIAASPFPRGICGSLFHVHWEITNINPYRLRQTWANASQGIWTKLKKTLGQTLVVCWSLILKIVETLPFSHWQLKN